MRGVATNHNPNGIRGRRRISQLHALRTFDSPDCPAKFYPKTKPILGQSSLISSSLEAARHLQLLPSPTPTLKSARVLLSVHSQVELPNSQVQLPAYRDTQPLSVPMIENIGRNMPATMKPTKIGRATCSERVRSQEEEEECSRNT